MQDGPPNLLRSMTCTRNCTLQKQAEPCLTCTIGEVQAVCNRHIASWEGLLCLTAGQQPARKRISASRPYQPEASSSRTGTLSLQYLMIQV